MYHYEMIMSMFFISDHAKVIVKRCQKLELEVGSNQAETSQFVAKTSLAGITLAIRASQAGIVPLALESHRAMELRIHKIIGSLLTGSQADELTVARLSYFRCRVIHFDDGVSKIMVQSKLFYKFPYLAYIWLKYLKAIFQTTAQARRSKQTNKIDVFILFRTENKSVV
jgi:hypothetical protein